MCALYAGQLEEGIAVLNTLTTPCNAVVSCGSSSLPMHDAIITNLATLYEVESDRSGQRKMALLERLASPLTGEKVNASSFKLN